MGMTDAYSVRCDCCGAESDFSTARDAADEVRRIHRAHRGYESARIRVLDKPVDPPPPAMSVGERVNEQWMHDAECRMEVRVEAFGAGMEAGAAAERETLDAELARLRKTEEAARAAERWIAGDCQPSAEWVAEGHNVAMSGADRDRGATVLLALRSALGWTP